MLQAIRHQQTTCQGMHQKGTCMSAKSQFPAYLLHWLQCESIKQSSLQQQTSHCNTEPAFPAKPASLASIRQAGACPAAGKL